jgi:septum formation protein
LILASRSPRRRELLLEAGYIFEVIPPSDAAESDEPTDQRPEALVARLAQQKAADVVRRIEQGLEQGSIPRGVDSPEKVREAGAAARNTPVRHALILGCDTVAECEGQVLGKPADESDARRMLQLLSGRRHRVLSGLCLWPVPGAVPQVRVAVTVLRMDPLSPQQLDEYLAGGQWQGKAGAFGYQDQLGWVHVLEGSPSNVVGLPLELLAEMLKLCP